MTTLSDGANDEAEQGARIGRDRSSADLLALDLPVRLFEVITARWSAAIEQRAHDPVDACLRYAADSETLGEHPTDEHGWCGGPHVEDERAPCPVVRRLATVYPEAI